MYHVYVYVYMCVYMICMCIRVHTYRCHKRTGGPSTCQARSRTWRRRAPSDAQVCLMCLPYVSASCVCLLPALYVCLPGELHRTRRNTCLVRLPYMSALYVWRGPAASAIARIESIPRSVLHEAINNTHA